MWVIAGAFVVTAAVAAACAPGAAQDGTGEPVGQPGEPSAVVRPTTTTSTTTPATTSTLVPDDTTTTTLPTTTTTEPVSGSTPTSFRAASTTATYGDCAVFPPDHFLNARHIDRLPVHPSSDQWVASLGGTAAKLSSPTSKVWNNGRQGIPVNVVDSTTTGFSDVTLNPNALPKAFRGKYPMPTGVRVEGYPGAFWDRHVLIVDTAQCMAYELIAYEPLTFQILGHHTAASGIRYSLDSNVPPALTTNSPDTPMIGQNLRVDEANAGRIAHAVGFCTRTINKSALWPARLSDGKSTDPAVAPMGAWARLRADVDLDRFDGQARAIVQGLREHGTLLTDTCDHSFKVMGENADGWNEAQVQQLQQLSAADFEFVDTSPMKVADNNFAVR